MATPNIVYYKPQIGTEVHCSYISGYNTVVVEFQSDISLNYYEVRVTKEFEEYDIGIGACPYRNTNGFAANTKHTFTIPVTPEFFPESGTYRVSLYAREALENTWDVTYLFITANYEIFQPVGQEKGEGMEVLTKQKFDGEE